MSTPDLGLTYAFIFAATLYTFLIAAIAVSIWRCLGLRSRFLKRWVGRAEGYPMLGATIRTCREGWHPERNRRRVVEEEEEGGLAVRIGGLESGGETLGDERKREGERGGEGAKRVLRRFLMEARGKRKHADRDGIGSGVVGGGERFDLNDA